jgi:hypothetical protein
MIFFRRPLRSGLHLLAVTTLTLCLVCTPSFGARRGSVQPVFAKSAEDPMLIGRIAALSPTIDPEEARRVVFTAYTTGRDLTRKWRVAPLPGIQNFLVNIGARKGGLCFQWAHALLLRLNELKLKTIELHWAESYPATASEHNVIVVTAIGQPFSQGIILDNWRYAGRLVWGGVTTDPEYDWKENKAELARRSKMKGIALD